MRGRVEYKFQFGCVCVWGGGGVRGYVWGMGVGWEILRLHRIYSPLWFLAGKVELLSEGIHITAPPTANLVLSVEVREIES